MRFALIALHLTYLPLALSIEATIQTIEKKGFLPHIMLDINGKSLDLEKLTKGKVVLVVNVASQCGYTNQYEGLQKLHEKYSSKGLVVLGVPSNDFGSQEPGTDKEIKQFCISKYNVSFSMLGKVCVLGKGKCSLYSDLTSKQLNPAFSGELEWNFTKFLLGKNGQVIGRFNSAVDPLDEKIVEALKKALAS